MSKEAADRTTAATPPMSPRAPLPQQCTVNVVCVPARDEADAIAARMLALLLEMDGYCANALGAEALAGEMIEAVRKVNADVVCISALPPGAVTHCRCLCKRLHR